MADNIIKTQIMHYIDFLPEFICLEDYAGFKVMMQSHNFGYINKENYNNYILVNFLLGNIQKQEIFKKSFLKKYCYFCKVYNNNGIMNIIVNKNENDNKNYYNDEILEKIKALPKSAIKRYLKIDEFSHFLEEKKEENDPNYDKIFELKSFGETGKGLFFIKSNINNNIDEYSNNNNFYYAQNNSNSINNLYNNNITNNTNNNNPNNNLNNNFNNFINFKY